MGQLNAADVIVWLTLLTSLVNLVVALLKLLSPRQPGRKRRRSGKR